MKNKLEIKAITDNGLVKLLARRFKDENKHKYNLYDYLKAKKNYICFMLGTYEPKRSWEDFYKKKNGK